MNPPELAAFLKSPCCTVRDWPKPKVNFGDVTTCLAIGMHFGPSCRRSPQRRGACEPTVLAAGRCARIYFGRRRGL